MIPKPIRKRKPEGIADKAFSHYIRLLYMEDGYCNCITCGKPHHWLEIEVGHYIIRRVHSLRFDEKNVHPQCTWCNRYNEGAPNEYRRFLENKYGANVFEYLSIKKKNKILDYRFYCELIYKEYRAKVKSLILKKPIDYPDWFIKEYGMVKSLNK